MKMKGSVADVKLNNGRYPHDADRTLASATGLPANTVLEWHGRVGRTYLSDIYRLVADCPEAGIGTDDAIIIRHNAGGVDDPFWDRVDVCKGFFAERRSYGQRVGVLARKYKLPFKLCLALGDREAVYPTFVAAMAQRLEADEMTVADLCAGYNRRKAGLRVVLGDDLYDAFGIEGMGQEHSLRVVNYVLERVHKI